MNRDAEREAEERRAKVADPADAGHGQSDLIAGETDAPVGAMTGQFPAEKIIAQRERRSISTTRGAFLVGAGILLSRIVGVVRQRVFAYFLGNSAAMDAFNAAFRIPNFLQNV